MYAHVPIPETNRDTGTTIINRFGNENFRFKLASIPSNVIVDMVHVHTDTFPYTTAARLQMSSMLPVTSPRLIPIIPKNVLTKLTKFWQIKNGGLKYATDFDLFS
jgi:hypothetical protein